MIRPKNLRRFKEITTILMRHGLGWLLAELGLGKLIPFHRGLLGHPKRPEQYTAAEHLRMAFEELGPTFIKMAQILSTRPDLISPEYASEFSRLQDSVPPVDFSPIKNLLESELRRPLNEIFKHFESTPLASASIGQVYRAQLHSGEAVVVKIQKPGIQEIIRRDMDVLHDVVKYMSQHTEFGRKYDLNGLYDEFRFTLENELDYVREGQNADQFRFLFKNDNRIYIPKVFWEWSTPKVLVMEEIQGIKVNELDIKSENKQLDRHHLAEIAVSLTFKEIFEFGFFHADPHPGNFVVLDNDTLGLMDFGLVGYLDQQTKQHFIRFSYAMTTGDIESLIDAMWSMGITGPFDTRPALKRDLKRLLYRVKDRSMKELAASDLIYELMNIAYQHQLHFPPDLALLFKVLAMSEGLGAMIDPDFKLFDFAQPYLRDLTKQMISPEELSQRFLENMYDMYMLTDGLPRRLSHLLQRFESDGIKVQIVQQEMEQKVKGIISAVDRLTISIIIALLVIALGIYILAGHFMGFDNYLVGILFIMFLFGAGISLRILWKIWRQSRF